MSICFPKRKIIPWVFANINQNLYNGNMEIIVQRCIPQPHSQRKRKRIKNTTMFDKLDWIIKDHSSNL